jgi:hypothetical protein
MIEIKEYTQQFEGLVKKAKDLPPGDEQANLRRVVDSIRELIMKAEIAHSRGKSTFVFAERIKNIFLTLPKDG